MQVFLTNTEEKKRSEEGEEKDEGKNSLLFRYIVI
jgi:hypothetical protein